MGASIQETLAKSFAILADQDADCPDAAAPLQDIVDEQHRIADAAAAAAAASAATPEAAATAEAIAAMAEDDLRACMPCILSCS